MEGRDVLAASGVWPSSTRTLASSRTRRDHASRESNCVKVGSDRRSPPGGTDLDFEVLVRYAVPGTLLATPLALLVFLDPSIPAVQSGGLAS
jgi:hypothetical protein